MKLNWGHGIFIAIALSVMGLATLAYLTTRERVDLVTEEYYPKELEYDSEIQKMKNANSLNDRVKVMTMADTLFIKYPQSYNKERVEGDVHFYYPSNKAYDRHYSIEYSKKREQAFPLYMFKKGNYDVIISWKDQKKEYLHKERIIIP